MSHRQPVARSGRADRQDRCDGPAQSSPAGHAAPRAPPQRSGTSQAASTRLTSCSVTTESCRSQVPGQPIAARLGAREAGDHMIDPHIRHLLRRLHRSADRTLGLVHHRDLAEAHPARPGRRGPDHPELTTWPGKRARRHRPVRAAGRGRQSAGSDRRSWRCRCPARRSRRAAWRARRMFRMARCDWYRDRS